MKTLIQKKKGSSLFSPECGEQRSLPPAPTSVAAPDPHGSLPVVPLIGDKRYYGESPARPAGGSGAGLEEPGARGTTLWGAKLGSDGSPRRGRQLKGQSRGTAWRVSGISGCTGERCPIFGHQPEPQLHKPNRLWQPGRLTVASGHRHPVAAGILPAVEGGILPPGPALEWRRTAIPPGKMPGSTAGRMPAATGQSGGGNEMRTRLTGVSPDPRTGHSPWITLRLPEAPPASARPGNIIMFNDEN